MPTGAHQCNIGLDGPHWATTTAAARVMGGASLGSNAGVWAWSGVGGRLVWGGGAGVWTRDGVGGRLAWGGSAVACARGGVGGKLAWGGTRRRF